MTELELENPEASISCENRVKCSVVSALQLDILLRREAKVKSLY
uniref:Bm14775 n=1 Tax=Brugia malayi TaxID=6279 RepID=A0A0J9Y5W5_BRUMA|nr:Bm14775 [Brugia malayi]